MDGQDGQWSITLKSEQSVNDLIDDLRLARMVAFG